MMRLIVLLLISQQATLALAERVMPIDTASVRYADFSEALKMAIPPKDSCHAINPSYDSVGFDFENDRCCPVDIEPKHIVDSVGGFTAHCKGRVIVDDSRTCTYADADGPPLLGRTLTCSQESAQEQQEATPNPAEVPAAEVAGTEEASTEEVTDAAPPVAEVTPDETETPAPVAEEEAHIEHPQPKSDSVPDLTAVDGVYPNALDVKGYVDSLKAVWETQDSFSLEGWWMDLNLLTQPEEINDVEAATARLGQLLDQTSAFLLKMHKGTVTPTQDDVEKINEFILVLEQAIRSYKEQKDLEKFQREVAFAAEKIAQTQQGCASWFKPTASAAFVPPPTNTKPLTSKKRPWWDLFGAIGDAIKGMGSGGAQ